MQREKIKQNETTFFINYSLDEKVDQKLVLETANNLTKQIIDEKKLDEKKIHELNINYSRKEEKLSIIIDYCKFDPEEIKSMPIEKQIHTVLIKMGYSEYEIHSIEYTKVWDYLDEKVWIAKIYDTDYNESLTDEMLEYLMDAVNQMNTLKKVLGFTVYIDYIKY